LCTAIFIDVATNKPSALEYTDVCARLDRYMDWLVDTYVDILNIIHECHDTYNYEANMNALIDSRPSRRCVYFNF
jgi:pyruvate-formate lyase